MIIINVGVQVAVPPFCKFYRRTDGNTHIAVFGNIVGSKKADDLVTGAPFPFDDIRDHICCVGIIERSGQFAVIRMR